MSLSRTAQLRHDALRLNKAKEGGHTSARKIAECLHMSPRACRIFLAKYMKMGWVSYEPGEPGKANIYSIHPPPAESDGQSALEAVWEILEASREALTSYEILEAVHSGGRSSVKLDAVQHALRDLRDLGVAKVYGKYGNRLLWSFSG